MNPLFWLPIGTVALGVLAGAYLGGRSRTTGAGTGALVGGSLAFMFTLPLLAIGLSNI